MFAFDSLYSYIKNTNIAVKYTDRNVDMGAQRAQIHTKYMRLVFITTEPNKMHTNKKNHNISSLQFYLCVSKYAHLVSVMKTFFSYFHLIASRGAVVTILLGSETNQFGYPLQFFSLCALSKLVVYFAFFPPFPYFYNINANVLKWSPRQHWCDDTDIISLFKL